MLIGCVSLICCSTADISLAQLADNSLTEAEKRSGWKLLLDGKTTAGWRNYQKKEIGNGWEIKDGALQRSKGGAGDIITKDQYKFFELSIEYKISKGGNSGIMFHVTEDAPAPWQTGPEVQLQDNVDGHDPQKAGWLYQLYKPEKPSWVKQFEKQVGINSPDIVDATRPAGEWNHVYLRIAANQCEVCLNGVSYFKFKKGDEDWNKRVQDSKFVKYSNFGKPTKGHICLQDHGNEVAFRNIKVRELSVNDGVPDPSDGRLPLKGVVAFPNLAWEGWQGVDADGKIQPLRPMELTYARDGTNRVFVASQRGMIHVFENDPDAKQAKLFLDIRDKVHYWKKDNEEGLLGLAMHPNYKENGEFFVYYSSETEPHVSIVSRWRVSKGNPNQADPNSEEVVVKLPQPFANHNGGSIAFGKDGYLYIGLGDGGSRNDPMSHGQNLETLMGSILRIDVDGKQKGKNYAIPPDNPFIDRPKAKPEIYAYGFRNVWRLSFDSETGDLWAGDVGQDLWEEVNLIRRGGNYGWSKREGTHFFGNDTSPFDDEPIDPVWEYDHQIGKSVTGGIVYRGKRLPELHGYYLYADYVSGKIWALKYDQKAGKVVRNMALSTTSIPVLAFGEDQHGEVYYFLETVNGRGIYRFEPIE
jgi:glucose/arabinose dehydrogenase